MSELMKKDFIMVDDRIAACKSNTAQMTVWEYLRFRHSLRSSMGYVLAAGWEFVESFWKLLSTLVVFVIGIPLFLLLSPVIAAREIRLARWFVCDSMARKGKKLPSEVHRVPFRVIEGKKAKAWAYNVVVRNLGLHCVLGIPNFDYMRQDRQSGDMVFYKLVDRHEGAGDGNG